MLAGGSNLDMMLVFTCNKSTCYAVFNNTAAIIEVLKLPGIPVDDYPALDTIAESFKSSRSAPSPIYGCGRALDGIRIK